MLTMSFITKVESQRKRNKFIGYGRQVRKKKEERCLATMTTKFRVCKGVDRLAQGLCIAVDTDRHKHRTGTKDE